MSGLVETGPPPGRLRRFHHPADGPVHDWCGEAMLPQPDWAHLRALAEQFTVHPERKERNLPPDDWWYLLTCPHQGLGIAVWRLLDPRFEDLLPRRQYQEWLVDRRDVRLSANREEWLRVAGPVIGELEAAGVTWATNSGPVQYLPLGIRGRVWPRPWDDFDLFVPATDHRAACAALEAAGCALDYVMNGDLNPVYKAGNGMRVEIIGLPPEHPDLAYWWWHHRPEFYAGRVLREVEGLPVWTPAPEWMVALMAYRTYVSFCRNAGPLPLWGLARLWAWRQWAGEAWDEGEFVRAIRLAAEVGFEATAHLPNVTWGRGILFTLDVASRVYGPLVPGELRGMLSGPFYFLRSTSNRREQAGEGEGAHVLCTIDEWPSDEAVVFDVGYNQGLEAKVASKLWRRVPQAASGAAA